MLMELCEWDDEESITEHYYLSLRESIREKRLSLLEIKSWIFTPRQCPVSQRFIDEAGFSETRDSSTPACTVFT